MIQKVRQGNDFILVWTIRRMGVLVDLSQAVNMKMYRWVDNQKKQVPFEYLGNGLVRVEVTAEDFSIIGTYRMILEYEFDDPTLMDGDDKKKVDVIAFRIVEWSEEAEQVAQIDVESDILLGLKGPKGDPFTYEDFTPEQLEDLQKPLTDYVAIAGVAENQREVNEGVRNDNENIRISNEDERILSEDSRVSSEGERVDAEIIREQQEEDRQTNTATAIDNAEIATQDTIDAKNDYYDVVKPDIIAQGEYATAQGDYAKAQGEAIQDDLGLKLDKSSVKQVLGASTTDVMSQKAVTDELAKKPQVVANYTHTSNKEVNIESIDFATGTITATGHGLAVNHALYPINKGMGNFPFSAIPNGINPLTVYFVVNVTPNTFQLSLSSGGAPTAISDKATKDYSKWHLESIGNATISGLSLRKFTVEFEGKSSGRQTEADYFYLYGGKNYGIASPVWFTGTEYGAITSELNRSIFKSMANGDIWSYNRLDIDVTGKRASILINGYRIYSLTETTSGIIRHNNEVAVHSSVGEDVVTSFYQSGVFNGMNIKVTKIL